MSILNARSLLTTFVQFVSADLSLNYLFICLPSTGQGMMTLSFDTFSRMVSPGTAKDGASVKTEETNLDESFYVLALTSI